MVLMLFVFLGGLSTVYARFRVAEEPEETADIEMVTCCKCNAECSQGPCDLCRQEDEAAEPDAQDLSMSIKMSMTSDFISDLETIRTAVTAGEPSAEQKKLLEKKFIGVTRYI